MANPMRVEFVAAGLRPMVGDVHALAAAVREANAEWQRLGALTHGMRMPKLPGGTPNLPAALPKGGSPASPGGGWPSGPVPRVPALKPLKLPTGPWQRLEKAHKDLADAMRFGSEAQAKDAQLFFDRAQKALAPRPMRLPTGPWQRVEDAQRGLQQAMQTGSAVQVRDAELALARAQKALAPKPLALPSGPWQRLDRAQRGLAQAMRSGTQAQVKDAELALQRAQAQIEKMQQGPATWQQRLLRAVFSTRFGSGGGMMPLVGRSLDVLFPGIHKGVFGGMGAGRGMAGMAGGLLKAGGMAALLNPLTIGITGTISAIIGLAMAAREAQQSLTEFRNAMTVSGGTAGDVSRLQAIGVQDIPGQAKALRERLGTDLFAMGASSRIGAGGFQMGRQWGKQDEAEILWQHLEGLRALGPGERQLAEARRLGLDGMLELVNVSNDVWRAEKRDAEVRKKAMDPASMQASRDLAAGIERVRVNFASLWSALGTPIVRWAADKINELASAIGRLAEWAVNVRTAFDDFFAGLRKKNPQAAEDTAKLREQWWWKLGQLTPAGLLGDFLLGNLDAKAAAKEKERRENTASERLTHSLDSLRAVLEEGMKGGGQRARATFGKGMHGMYFSRALESQAMSVGAFAFAF